MRREHRIFRGAGVRIRNTPLGDVLRFNGQRPEFEGAWMVTLIDDESATIAPGTVNLVDATIKGVKLSAEPAPVLRFGRLKLDKEGRGFICAEVTCKPEDDWRVIGVEIVQVADPDSDDGAPGDGKTFGTGAAAALKGHRARHPLAMLRRRKDGSVEVYQISWFPLKHRVALAADGKSAQRHFFY